MYSIYSVVLLIFNFGSAKCLNGHVLVFYNKFLSTLIKTNKANLSEFCGHQFTNDQGTLVTSLQLSLALPESRAHGAE